MEYKLWQFATFQNFCHFGGGRMAYHHKDYSNVGSYSQSYIFLGDSRVNVTYICFPHSSCSLDQESS